MKKIRLTFQGNIKNRIFLIQQSEGMSIIGEMWKELDRDTDFTEIQYRFNINYSQTEYIKIINL